MDHFFTKSCYAFFCFVLALAIQGCLSDAPHDNPLEFQQNPASFDIEGIVQTFYPHSPSSIIQNALIILQPGNVATFSNSEGKFTFRNISSGNYVLICQAEGFLSDTLPVQVPLNQPVVFKLDGLPYFKNIQLTTHHIAQWFPAEDFYFIECTITVSDTDGVSEINSVWMGIPNFGIQDTLNETTTGGVFNHIFIPAENGFNSIHELEGQRIIFSVQDDFGAIVQSEPITISRIIEDSPILQSPVEWQVVSIPFEFQWQMIFLPFSFSLKLEIYRILPNITLKVAEIPDISSSTNRQTYSSFLTPGDYFWTLTIIDTFGNSSRSREGSFRVQ